MCGKLKCGQPYRWGRMMIDWEMRMCSADVLDVPRIQYVLRGVLPAGGSQ